METNIRNRKKIRAVILAGVFLFSIVAPPFNNVWASLVDARKNTANNVGASLVDARKNTANNAGSSVVDAHNFRQIMQIRSQYLEKLKQWRNKETDPELKLQANEIIELLSRISEFNSSGVSESKRERRTFFPQDWAESGALKRIKPSDSDNNQKASLRDMPGTFTRHGRINLLTALLTHSALAVSLRASTRDAPTLPRLSPSTRDPHSAALFPSKRFVDRDGLVKTMADVMKARHYDYKQMSAYLAMLGYQWVKSGVPAAKPVLELRFVNRLKGGMKKNNDPNNNNNNNNSVQNQSDQEETLLEAQNAIMQGLDKLLEENDLKSAIQFYLQGMKAVKKAKELGADISSLNSGLNALYKNIIEKQTTAKDPNNNNNQPVSKTPVVQPILTPILQTVETVSESKDKEQNKFNQKRFMKEAVNSVKEAWKKIEAGERPDAEKWYRQAVTDLEKAEDLGAEAKQIIEDMESLIRYVFSRRGHLTGSSQEIERKKKKRAEKIESRTKEIIEELNLLIDTEQKREEQALIEVLHKKQINQLPNLKKELEMYVPERAVRDIEDIADETRTFDLDSEVKKFLGNEEKKVLLIQGGSGTGKTTYSHYLTHRLWENYNANPKSVPPWPDNPQSRQGRDRSEIVSVAAQSRKAGSNPNPAKRDQIQNLDPRSDSAIPLYVSLPQMGSKVKDQLMQKVLKHNGIREKEIELFRNKTFILILDGYDEMAAHPNLYDDNQLGEWKVKVIVTCRSQSGYDASYFVPFRLEKPLYGKYQELVLTPFNEKQIIEYLQKYVSLHEVEWKNDWERYWEKIQQIGGLRELVETPFVLSLVTEVLPMIVNKREKEKEKENYGKLMLLDLYDLFMENWFTRQKRKLIRQGNVPQGGRDILKDFWEYAKKLAQSMEKQKKTSIGYDDLTQVLGSEDQENRRYLARCAAPIKKVSKDVYSFLHKSLQEYLSARGNQEELMNLLNSETNNNNNVNAQYIQEQLIGDPATLRFMAEMAEKDKNFKEKLLKIVLSSREREDIAIDAANAITILNAARFSFSGMDLHGIRIPGADLSGGVFDSVNFRGADVSRVKFRQAWLKSARLEGAEMSGVEFGERAYMDVGSGVNSVAYSPDGKRVVSGSNDSTVRVWDAETGKVLAELKGHTYVVSSVSFSPDGKMLTTGSSDHSIKVWDVSRVLEFRSSGVSELEDTKMLGQDILLLWSSGHPLFLEGALISEVRGLSEANRRLMLQRGAVEKSDLGYGRDMGYGIWDLGYEESQRRRQRQRQRQLEFAWVSIGIIGKKAVWLAGSGWQARV